MKDINQIAKDLSIELSKSNFYDIDVVALKIKSAFKVLLDEEIKSAHTEKLKWKTEQQKKMAIVSEKTSNFWKKKCRSVFTEQQMNEFYDTIDAIREMECI